MIVKRWGAPGRKAAAALVGLLFVGGTGLWWALRAPRSPRDLVQRWWAREGVDRPNVILVTLDTTRADHLGCYGYGPARTPNLDAIAQGGVLFAQASAVAPLTQPAHSSIMTGMYPTHHGVHINGNAALGPEQQTIAEVLLEKGYHTGAFVGAFVLDGRWGLNQGFQVYDDRFDLEKYKHLDLASVQRPADKVVDAALAWLEKEQQHPFFAWIHFYDAHSPYEPPEPFVSEYRAQGLAGLYDGEIAFVDQQLGRCVSWLRAKGLDRKTALVVIGDHGEGLGSHGEGTHGYFVYDYALRVPLLVATPFPELHGVKVDAQVSAVDVFPTVLALAGLPATEVHGRSLLPLMLHAGEDQTSYAYSESMTASLQFGWAPLQSLRGKGYKLIKAPRPELYDLSADPAETTNVYEQQPAVAKDLMRRLDGIVEETSRGAPTPASADLDKDTQERLAALGYLGGPGPAKPADPSQPLADPKDKLGVFSAVQQAGELIMHDEYAEAAKALEAALAEDAKMPQARLMLGTSYAELGRRGEAKAQFDLVLKDDPKSIQALVGMANLLQAEGRTEEVIALCKQTLALDARNSQAHTLLGEVYAEEKRPAEALPYFEKAAEIQPKLTRNRLNLAGALTEVKQYGRAAALLHDIVKDHPRFPFAQYNLGLLYEEQGRLPEARSAYAAEVAAYPGHFKARFNLGKVLYQLGDRAGSLEQMREVVRIAPTQAEGYLLLARGLLQESAPLDTVEGLAQKGLALTRAPDLKVLGWLLLADVYNRRREPEKENDALRKAESYKAIRNGGAPGPPSGGAR
jgi:arylsulfatase A-like enzyme/tetratricopeptide (TPR) repeat protein